MGCVSTSYIFGGSGVDIYWELSEHNNNTNLVHSLELGRDSGQKLYSITPLVLVR